MINSKRIVPIERTDLLTLLGTQMKLAGTSVTAIEASDIGIFAVSGSGNVGNKIANEPLVSLDFKTGVTAAVIYFIPDYYYQGFKVAGTSVTTAGTEVVADGATLYTATLSSSTVTIAKVGF